MGGMVIYRQRGNYDCKLATLATALQRDYGAMWPEEFCQRVEANGGCYGELVKEAWGILGFEPNIHFWQYPVMHKLNGVHYIVAYLRSFGAARVMLQVPSLNDDGKNHLILYWRGRIFDPSNRKRYETVTDLTEIQWTTVFDEKLIP